MSAGVIEDGAWTAWDEGVPQGASASPLLANVYLHYVFDLWAHQWRRRHARGDVVLTRFADDLVAGFEHRDDAERFRADLRERFAEFNLELADEKTRLIEFGRHAARNRQAQGLGKPETFSFLGFTHICGKTRKGRFMLKRITDSKRMRAKLSKVKTELMRRRHLPIPEQGRWLASVIRGHCNYYAVPSNGDAITAFRTQATRHWCRALRRRSQRNSLTWERMDRLATRWLPPARILHPWPDDRFAANTQGRSRVR
jgi:RNA-directed DNA polymerase